MTKTRARIMYFSMLFALSCFLLALLYATGFNEWYFSLNEPIKEAIFMYAEFIHTNDSFLFLVLIFEKLVLLLHFLIYVATFLLIIRKAMRLINTYLGHKYPKYIETINLIRQENERKK